MDSRLDRLARLATAAGLAIVLAACGSTAPASVAPTAAVTGSTQPTTAASSVSPPSGPPEPTDLAAQLDAMVAALDGFNGSALIALGDEVLLSKGYGLADTDLGVPNSPKTRFRLGSITKQFTAMGILILQARGKLDVDQAACTYLPTCPAGWKPITISQLLSHTAGLPEFTDLPDYDPTKDRPSTPVQTLARIKDLPLEFTPGETFSYSNSNYIALGLIIERVAGATYEDFLRANIFAPLEMQDTGYEHDQDGLAAGYKSEGVPADPIDMSVPYAAGALYSTVLDMYRWGRALETDRLVPRDLMSKMFTPVPESSDGSGGGYGYGVAVHGGTRVEIYHDGGIDGFNTYFGHYPDARLNIVLLANRESVPGFREVDYAIAGAVLDR